LGVEKDNGKMREFLKGKMVGLALGTLASSYLALAGIGFFLSEKMIFRPPFAGYQDNADVLKLSTRDGEKISALYFPNPQATYTILYSHGNGSDLGSIRPLLIALQQLGFSVFAYDYRGYGTSEGTPTEQNTYEDITTAYQYLTEVLQIPANRIILYGHSVGSGPSIDLATRYPVAGVILEGAFTSTFRVAIPIPILPFDRFDNLSKIRSVRSPILVIHGTQDDVIPFSHGQKLYEQANQPKQFVAIAGAEHNNLMEVAGLKYRDALMNFVKLIEAYPR
jgi:fermentation-respiration switch protein FrsA (DUF1100 family)